MGSIPAAILRFQIGGPELSGAIRPALDQIKREAKVTSEQIAEDWKRMAAQIRATVATEASGTNEIAAARKDLVNVLGRQLSLHSDLSNATNKELANYKAMTLELERQTSFLKNKGGITAGTSNAINQLSTQSYLGITRVLDSLIDRYVGGAAGAAFRTVRDVGYYSSIAGGAAGTGGAVDGIAGGFSKIVEAIGPATIAATGLTAALAGMGVAAAAVTIDLAKQNEHFEILAQQTGLSSQQIQVFNQLAKEMDLDVNGLVSSVDRFQFALAEYQRKGAEGANVETERTIDALKRMGIEVESKPGQLRPAVDILGDLSETLRAIPDPGKRAQEALDVLGIRGKELAPYLLSAKGSLRDLLDQIQKTGPIIDQGMGDVLEKAKGRWDALERSVSKMWLTMKEGVALGFLDATKFLAINPPGLTQSQQGVLAEAQKAGARPLAPGEKLFVDKSLSLGQPNKPEMDYNAERIKTAEIIEGKTRLQGELEEKRKELNEAIRHNQGDQAVELAKQVHSLESAVKAEGERAKLAKEYADLINKAVLHPGRPESFRKSQTTDQVFKELQDKYALEAGQRTGTLFGATGAPVPGLLTAPFLSDLFGGGASISGVIGPQAGPSPTVAANVLIKQINDEHEELFKTQREKDIEHYDDELKNLNSALQDQLKSEQLSAQQKLEAQQAYNDAAAKLQQDRNKTLADLDTEYEGKAGKLFDDLLGGKGKAFGKSFETDIINIAVAPIKSIFEQTLGGLFGNLSRTVNAPFSGAAGGTSTGGFNFGGIFSGLSGLFGLGKGIGPGGTAGIFPGSLGIGGSSSTAGAGQFGVASMTVTAGVVNLTGQLGLPGTGPLGGGGSTGNFFGNLNPFSSDSSLPIDAQAAARAAAAAGIGGGSTSSIGGSSILSSLGPFLAGGALLGMGLGTKNTTAAIMGAATLTGSALTSISSSLASSQGISNLSDTLGIAGKALPGVGMLAAGIQKGGVGGTLEATAGGAQIGTAIAPGIGTAIGAGVGLIAGVLSSIISGPSFAHQVQQNMYNQQYHAPPSETFSFAMGNTIAQTLSTGFNQSGSNFGTYGLAAGTPFFANPITGRLSKDQQIDLAKEQMGLLSNQPFLGFPTTDPFVGQGNIGKYKGTGAAPNVNIHVNTIDAAGVADFFTTHGDNISRILNSRSPYSSSSGMGSSVRRLAFPP